MPSQTAPVPPEILDTRCATCRAETEHDVLKGKVVRGGLGVEGTFRCRDCATTHSGLVTFPVPVDIPFIVSVQDAAQPHAVQVFEDDQVAVGDEFEIDGALVEVTAIELKDEARRVRRARAPDIKALWGKNIDHIRIGFSLNVGSVTHAFEADFGPEDEISVGEEFTYEDQDVIVDRIITQGGKRFRGTFNVREIKRVWLRKPPGSGPVRRAPPKDVPRSQKEQRQANRKTHPGPRTGAPRRSPAGSGDGGRSGSRPGGSGGRSSGGGGGPRSGGSGGRSSGGRGGPRGGPRGGGSGGPRRGGAPGPSRPRR